MRGSGITSETFLPLVGVFFAVPLVVFFILRYKICGGVVKYSSRNRLDGQTIVITGGNSGIGRQVAIECAKLGGRVILACRDKTRAEGAVALVRRKSGNEAVNFLPLDLSSLDSVRQFVQLFRKQYNELHVLINNAAYMGPKASTVDGLDRAFSVNYIGHYLLTRLLQQVYHPTKKHPLRVINVASDAYRKGRLDPEDLLMRRSRSGDIYKTYATSKLAMLLFSLELNVRAADGSTVSVAVHPGAVKSGLQRNWPGFNGKVLRLAASWLFRSPEDGAQTVIHCALADDMSQYAGKFMFDCQQIAVEPAGRDFKMAAKLWAVTEELCSLTPEAKI